MEGGLEKFEFKIDGPVLKAGVPIHLAISALDNFQSIVDKAYLVATGGKRTTAKDRSHYQLRATRFSHGSFLTFFEIAFAGVQLGLPFVSELGPQNLWAFTKDTFNFLKLVCGETKAGQQPEIEIHDSNDISVRVGDVHQNFHGPVLNIAEKSISKYQDLAHLLERGMIEKISAGTQRNPEIFLELKDRDLFDLSTRIDDEPVEIECEIFNFNKFKNIGKLRVSMGQLIPEGDYRFSIVGTQDNVNYIFSMLRPVVKISCLL